MGTRKLLSECSALRSENERLRAAAQAAKSNIQTGMRSLRELALTWLCHEYNVYYAETGKIMPDYVEKLLAIEKLDNGRK